MSRIAILALVTLWGCIPMQPKPDPDTPDPHIYVRQDCMRACQVLTRYQCAGNQGSPGPDELWGTADDVGCAQACVEIVTSDPTVTLNEMCVAEAQSCEAVERCFELES